jgi:ABC-type glutathione transport system ATPase component
MSRFPRPGQSRITGHPRRRVVRSTALLRRGAVEDEDGCGGHVDVELVGLDARQSSCLPRMLSGGQRQRVAIARSLAAEPRILILDESVAALDVSIQAQVLNLLADIRDETGVSYVLISHDLAVVRQLAEQVIVLWKGQIVEQGQTGDVLDNPQHEYTQRLRASVPRPGWKPARKIAAASDGVLHLAYGSDTGT